MQGEGRMKGRVTGDGEGVPVKGCTSILSMTKFEEIASLRRLDGE